MWTYVQVLILSQYTPTTEGYTYHWDDSVFGEPVPGVRVIVPLGRGNKSAVGLITDYEQSDVQPDRRIKSVSQVLDMTPMISTDGFEYARWLHKYFFMSFYHVYNAMLPPGDYRHYHMDEKGKLRITMQQRLNRDFYYAINDESRVEDIPTNAVKQLRVYNVLRELEEPVKADELEEKAQVDLPVLKRMEEKGLIVKIDRLHPVKTLNLNDEQQKVRDDINQADTFRHIIYGITGSGKTETYVALSEDVIKKGEKVLVLVAEIGLIPEMVYRFSKYFDEDMAIIHSQMSMGDRLNAWEKTFNGEAKIIIGTRSAAMIPFENIGLIIVDEFHDQSYRPIEGDDFNVVEAVEYQSRKHDILLILGSATPLVSYWYRGEQGHFQRHELTKRFQEKKTAEITVVDMQEELRRGNRKIFSGKLLNEMEETLTRKEQIMLFLNRRGYSTFITCRDCGHLLKCPQCDRTLTYHRSRSRLICHMCGYTEKIPHHCPECGSEKIKYFGIGTEQIEASLNHFFPDVTTLRMDRDTTTNRGVHEHIITQMKEQKTDVLIGTQMITKGHDFPGVTLVGILAADMSLSFPDYKSPEVTFNLITQAAGRAGRGDKAGRVMLQTYEPEHYAIIDGKNQDFYSFYNNEIALRESFHFPPFYELLSIEYYARGEDNRLFKSIIVDMIKAFETHFAPSEFQFYPVVLDEFLSKAGEQVYLFQGKWQRSIADEALALVYELYLKSIRADNRMIWNIERW